MRHINRTILLGLTVSLFFILGSLATPAAALQVNSVIEKYNQAIAPGANNHTYVFVKPDPLNLASMSRMHVNEDLDYNVYSYDATGWARSTNSLSAPGNPQFNWQPYSTFGNGPFGNPTYLPVFFDFIGSDGSGAVINTTLERRSFTLGVGTHTPVVMEGGYVYFGALSISGQEFVNLVVSSGQDGLSWSATVIDPLGRYVNQVSGTGGDILVVPFRPAIAGNYIVVLQANHAQGTFAIFDLYPVAASVTSIAFGEVVQGTLPTGELIVRSDTGSLVHQEMAPTVYTYKVTSPADVASVTYAFNYPEVSTGVSQITGILFTSDAYEHDYNGGHQYVDDSVSPGNGRFYYRGGPLYVTVYGGDNVAYTLYHQDNGGVDLPLDHAFPLENEYGTTIQKAYRLNVPQDSLLKANSTGAGTDYGISVFGVHDGFFKTQAITDGPTFQAAQNYFLPAGDYVVLIDIASTTYANIEFSFAPIVAETTTANLVHLGGFRVPTNPCELYNMTLHLDTLDNITVAVQYGVYDEFYQSIYTTTATLANRWDGSHWIQHPTYDNSSTVLIGRAWSDNYAFITMTVRAFNNTGAPVEYANHTVRLTVDWEEYTDVWYDGVTTLDIRSVADSNNFTLAFPGTSPDYFALRLNTTPGTWYNVSVKTRDVSSFTATLYSHYDSRTHSTQWVDLNDELVGSLPAISFQFGAISEYAVLHIQVGRTLAMAGFLWVEITPMESNTLTWLNPLSAPGPDILALLASIALPLGVGVAAIVVVYFVYTKKIKKV